MKTWKLGLLALGVAPPSPVSNRQGRAVTTIWTVAFTSIANSSSVGSAYAGKARIPPATGLQHHHHVASARQHRSQPVRRDIRAGGVSGRVGLDSNSSYTVEVYDTSILRFASLGTLGENFTLEVHGSVTSSLDASVNLSLLVSNTVMFSPPVLVYIDQTPRPLTPSATLGCAQVNAL
jgi:hypothetical protein